QAEDGIRDGHVTGVQTCALPILAAMGSGLLPAGGAHVGLDASWFGVTSLGGPATTGAVAQGPRDGLVGLALQGLLEEFGAQVVRSEERRVGKECRWGW